MADRDDDVTLKADQAVASGTVTYRITRESHWELTDVELVDLRANTSTQAAFDAKMAALGGATASWYATFTQAQKAALRNRVIRQLPA